MTRLRFPYHVQIQIEGCNSLYYGEGNNLAEAVHVALFKSHDAVILTERTT